MAFLTAILERISSGVSVKAPCVCLGEKEAASDSTEPESFSLAMSISWCWSGRAGTGGIYALWKALVLRDSPEGRAVESAKETRETRVSGAKETRETRSVELRAAGLRRPTPVTVRLPSLGSFSSPPSTPNVLEGRRAPKEKEELRAPTAIELRMAALAPAAETDFQSAEMVDMRLSTASVHFFLLSLFLLRFILIYAPTHNIMKSRGIRMAAAFLPDPIPGFVARSLTGVTPIASIWFVSAAEGTPDAGSVYVAVKTGPLGNLAWKTRSLVGTIMICRDCWLVEFHQRGMRSAWYVPLDAATPVHA